MESTSANGKPIAPAPRPVLSRAAILILSGVLIWTAVARGHLTGVDYCGICAGTVGLIAFLALDSLALVRQRRVVNRTLESARHTLDSRIERHVASSSARTTAPRCRRPRADEASYLTVTVA